MKPGWSLCPITRGSITQYLTFNNLVHIHPMLREGWRYQIGWILGKVPMGGVVIANPKIYIADIGNFKQGYLGMKLVKRRVISRFRVCFSTIVLILTDIIWPMPPCINATISIIKICNIIFQKWGGVSKAVFQKFIWFGSGILPLEILKVCIVYICCKTASF